MVVFIGGCKYSGTGTNDDIVIPIQTVTQSTVNLRTAGNLEGRALAMTENVTLQQTTITVPLTRYDLTLDDTGTEGWRMMSTPTSDNSYDDLLGDIWTQGIGAGADVTTGTANVQLFNTTTETFAAVTDLGNNMTTGTGFITYVYSDDDYTNSSADAGFPKTLSVTGTKNSGDVTATLNQVADEWSLVGNPYASTIDWGVGINKTDLMGVVYVYDHAYATPTGDDKEATGSAGSYRTWNGTAGSLTDGLIAAFQGFWVQNVKEAELTDVPALEFTEDSKSTGGTFYKQSTQSASFRMIAKMDGFSNDAYFSFSNEGLTGKDNYDALKLAPLDYANYLSLSTEIDGTLMDINNLPLVLKKMLNFH